MIHILDSDLKLKAILRKVTSSAKTEAINDENSLNFTTFVSLKTNQYLTIDCVIELDNDYFDIARLVKEQKENGSCIAQVETEHISYRLNNPEYNMDTFAATGTPTAVLETILDGTPFTVGTVEFTEAVTYSASEAKSRRALLMEFAEYIGAELDFDKFVISLVAHRGSTAPKILTPNKNIKVVAQILDKRNTDSSGNPLVSYTCTPIGTDLSLGDEVLLFQKKLGIQEQLRIVYIVTDPYDKSKVSVEIANRIETLEDEIYRIQTTTLVKGKAYNSCSISAEDGFMAVRSDGLAKSVVNATEGFSLYSGTIAGSLDRNFFVDTDGRIKAKDIDIDGSGTFNGSITIGTGDNVFKANGSDGIWLGDTTFADAPFSVDLNGNLIAHNGQFVDGNISGTDIYGGAYHDSNENTNLVLSPQGEWADLIFERASTGQNMFEIYDAGSSVTMSLGNTAVCYCGLNSNTIYAFNRWQFIGDRIGFFGATPVVQQTATKIPTPSTATAYDCAIKINGILDKLGNIVGYGLFDIS